MNFLVVGGGAMGRRHIVALCEHTDATRIVVLDRSPAALAKVQDEIAASQPHLEIVCMEMTNEIPTHLAESFDGCILATTAEGRLELFEQCLALGVRRFLVEKPVEQSLARYLRFKDVADEFSAEVHVDFVRRLQPAYIQIWNDILARPQFRKSISLAFHSGAIGIGANAIHDLDLYGKLFGAVDFEMLFAEIDDAVIPSGRGPQFRDYGGRAAFNLLGPSGDEVAKCYFHVNPRSSATANISIVAENGRLEISEVEGVFSWRMRVDGSDLPVYRYNREYTPLRCGDLKFNSLEIGVRDWVGSFDGGGDLPDLDGAELAHRIMFAWLSADPNAASSFPIT